MPTLVRKTKVRLWREYRYDMTLLADGAALGLPVRASR
jgi:hypothetical protein